jgi:hypothetical protein
MNWNRIGDKVFYYGDHKLIDGKCVYWFKDIREFNIAGYHSKRYIHLLNLIYVV